AEATFGQGKGGRARVAPLNQPRESISGSKQGLRLVVFGNGHNWIGYLDPGTPMSDGANVTQPLSLVGLQRLNLQGVVRGDGLVPVEPEFPAIRSEEHTSEL